MARKKKEIIVEGKWFEDECDVDRTDIRQNTGRCETLDRTKRQGLAQHDRRRKGRVVNDK